MEKRFNYINNLCLSGSNSRSDTLRTIKIAIVTFAFDNAEMIKRLRKRGKAIRKEKWELLDKINNRISDRLECQECLDKMQRPVAVFLTMETEEGKNIAE